MNLPMTDSSHNLIEVEDASKTYRSEDSVVEALAPISLSVGNGESIVLVGPSGCGKTTLLLMLAGLEGTNGGLVYFGGRRLDGPRREIGLVLQEYGLFPWKTVRRNIELGLKIRGEKTNSGTIDDMLAELDIADKADLYPQQLSGGQKQRVALGRALILKPSLLLLDEPFAALDTLTRERLQDLIAGICRTRGLSMVLVTHNIPEAVRLGEKIMIMSGIPGKIANVLDNPMARNADYRASDQFYTMTRQLRSELEKYNA